MKQFWILFGLSITIMLMAENANGTKPGTCPYPQFRWGETCPPEESPYQQLCKNDSECPGDQKCCSYWRIMITDCYVCLPPAPIPAVTSATRQPAKRTPKPTTQLNTNRPVSVLPPSRTTPLKPTSKPPVTHSAQKPHGTKPGTCPYPQFRWGETCPPSEGAQLCKNDSECPGDQKCCSYWRIMITDCYVCVPPVSSARAVKPSTRLIPTTAKPTNKSNSTKPGTCPYPQFRWGETCPPSEGAQLCKNDSECPGDQKCCSYWRIMITDCYVCVPPVSSARPVKPSTRLIPTTAKPTNKSNSTKPGTCPYPGFSWSQTCPPSYARQLCSNDSQCPGAQKCCQAWRLGMTDCFVCVAPVPVPAVTIPPAKHHTHKETDPHEGFCPAVNDSTPVLCIDPPPCQTDGDCMAFEKCCFTGCSNMCMESVQEQPIVDPVPNSGGCTYYNGKTYENQKIFKPYDNDDCTLCFCSNGESTCYNMCNDRTNVWVAASIVAGGALLISLIFTLSVCCCLKCCCTETPHQTIVMQQPPMMQYPQVQQPRGYYIGLSNDDKKPLTSEV